MRTAMIFLLAVGVVLGTMESMPGQAPDRAGAATVKALGRLPLYFVENRGVYPDSVRYYIQGADKTLYFTNDGVTFALKGKQRSWTVKLDFVGANQDARPEGLDKQEAVFSYFKGPEKDWRAGLPTFSKIVYRDLWPGIDLVYNGTVNKLKYEFRVAPGADPKLIRLEYRGAESVTATDAGALRVATPEGSFEDAPPLAWQDIDGKRVPVAMAYGLGERGEFAFSLGDYDRTRPLVLDPAVIVYCGYIGGSGEDFATDAAVDRQGNLYVVGRTTSTEKTFPHAVGPDLTFNSSASQADVFVAKVSPSGGKLLYCGYIGGDGSDFGYGIAVDGSGAAYVAGSTASSIATFPLSVGPGNARSGSNDAFVAKVNPSGTGLVYCGTIGGSGGEKAMDIAVDANGCAYLSGFTSSTESQGFPVRGGPDRTHNGGYDCFVAKVASSGQSLIYCGYIGGSKNDAWVYKAAIAVDASGAAYVASATGSSESDGFPITVGPDITFNGGVEDHFVAKVVPSGASLAFCGYIGGAGNESGRAPGECDIAVDSAGCAYVVGQTSSGQGFPVNGGPGVTFSGGHDVYIAKVAASGATLNYCGFIGGTKSEFARGVAVDRHGNAYVGGCTSSDHTSTFPLKVGPGFIYGGGAFDGFVAKLGPSGALVSCGYIGGSDEDVVNDVAVDSAGNIYVVGETRSDETKLFPLRVGPDVTHNGGPPTGFPYDAFVAKIALLDDLTVSGTPRPGTSVTLNLAAIEARGLPYQVGTSLGAGPIKVGTRAIGLSLDGLLGISVGGLWPHVFQGYSGMLDGQGKASAKIVIPNAAVLIGQNLYSAFVTLDPSWPSSIRSISETRVIGIVK